MRDSQPAWEGGADLPGRGLQVGGHRWSALEEGSVHTGGPGPGLRRGETLGGLSPRGSRRCGGGAGVVPHSGGPSRRRLHM